MAIVSPTDFSGILANAPKWDQQPFLAQQAANAAKRIEANSLESVAKINARNALDQIRLTGKNARADRELAAAIERRQGARQALLNFATTPLGGTTRFAGGLDGVMAQLVGKLAPRDPAQIMGGVNALLEEGSRGRQVSAAWKTGDRDSRAIEALGWPGLLS